MAILHLVPYFLAILAFVLRWILSAPEKLSAPQTPDVEAIAAERHVRTETGTKDVHALSCYAQLKSA